VFLTVLVLSVILLSGCAGNKQAGGAEESAPPETAEETAEIIGIYQRQFEVVSIFSVSAMSFSVNGRILSSSFAVNFSTIFSITAFTRLIAVFCLPFSTHN